MTRTFELGLRGEIPRRLRWSATTFWMRNADDILFVSTGGATSNEGFFDNVADTRRTGLELALDGELGALAWRLDYSYLQAEFLDSFAAPSAHHPDADAAGEIHVERGDRIPGIPRHILKGALDLALGPSFRLGADLVFDSEQYLRGDEANLLHPVDSFACVGLHAEWRVVPHLRLHVRIDNVFNSDYESFGTLGDAAQVLGAAASDPRFLSPGAPRAIWGGAELEF